MEGARAGKRLEADGGRGIGRVGGGGRWSRGTGGVGGGGAGGKWSKGTGGVGEGGQGEGGKEGIEMSEHKLGGGWGGEGAEGESAATCRRDDKCMVVDLSTRLSGETSGTGGVMDK